MADRIRGITIDINGNTTKLQEALKAVNSTLKTTQSDLKDINKLLKLDPTNTTLLKQKQEALAQAIKATEEKLKQEKTALDQMKANNATGEVTEQQKALEREIVETEQKLKGLNKEMKDFGSVGQQQVKAVAEKMSEIGNKIKEVGEKITNVGKTMSTTVTLPIVAAGTMAVKSFAEVDKTMQLTNKTMGNTAEQAELLNDAMKDAAANSTFGMSEAAQATLNFARAGLSAEEAAAALAPAMNLAAGEGGELATVSAGLVATINGFGDAFENTEQYADIFAAACNNSALEINALVSSMSIAAPVFKAAGYDVKDASLYMGVMANAGIDANTAATALKTGLARLAKPSKEAAVSMKELGINIFDADGNMKDSITVQRELHNAFAQLSAQEQLAAASAIFGKNQMSNWLALISTAPEEVMTLSAALNDCAGTTDEMAEAMMSGVGGSLEKLKSSLDVLSTSFGELIGTALLPVIEKIQEFIDWLNSLDEETKTTIVQVAAIVAAVGPLLIIIGQIATGVGALINVISKVSTAIATMPPQVMAVVAVIAVLTAAYVGLESAMNKMDEENKRLSDSTNRLNAEQKALVDSANAVIDTSRKSAEARNADRTAMAGQQALVGKLTNELRGYVDANGNVVEESGRVRDIVNELNTIMPELNLAYDEQTNAISMTADEVERYTEALLRQAEAAAIQEQLTEIMKERIEIEQQMATMEDEVAAAEQRATEAALAYHEAESQLKDISELTNAEYQAQQENLEALRQAQMDAAVECSAATGPYYEMQTRLQELGNEQDYLTEKVGSSSAALGEGANAAIAAAAGYDEAADAISDSWAQMMESTEKSIAGQIKIFDEYTAQTAKSKEEILKNMQEQVAGLQNWSQNLQDLSRKGVSEGMLQELAKMGPDGAAYVQAFNQMSAAELANASKMFEEALAIPGETLVMVEENYRQLGEKEYEAYNSALENGVTVQHQKTMDSWKKVGEGVPSGVVKAIEDHEKDVTDAVQTMSEDMQEEFQTDNQMHSPSKVYEDFGINIIEGLVQGIDNNIRQAESIIAELGRTMQETAALTMDRDVWYEYGIGIGEALVDGLNAMLPAVQEAAASLAAAANSAAGAAGSVGAGGGGRSAAGGGNSLQSIGPEIPDLGNYNGLQNNTFNGATTQSASNNVTNNTPINIEVYATDAQNPAEIAQAVADSVSNEVGRLRSAWY